MTFQKKVTQNGFSFQMVLPKYWVEMNNIGRRSKVYCQITKDGALIVTANEPDKIE